MTNKKTKAETLKPARKRKNNQLWVKHKLLDPQQIEFLAMYNNPQSPTFGNARQSALKAGYSEEYALNITAQAPIWLSESQTIDRGQLLATAERNLQRYASMTPESDTDKKLQVDVSKFVSERLGKTHYSTRNESVNVHLNVATEEQKKSIEEALDDVL